MGAVGRPVRSPPRVLRELTGALSTSIRRTRPSHGSAANLLLEARGDGKLSRPRELAQTLVRTSALEGGAMNDCRGRRPPAGHVVRAAAGSTVCIAEPSTGT